MTNKKLIFSYCILVVFFIFAFNWLVPKDKDVAHSETVMQPRPKPEAEVLQVIKISAAIQKTPPEVKEKAEKAPVANKSAKTEEAHKEEPTEKALSKDKAAAKEEKVIKVTEKHREVGLSLLKGDQQAPLVELDFKKIGVSRYFSIMKEMGGRVFVGSGSARKLLAEAVFHDNGGLSFVGFKEGAPETEGLAISRPHEIINEGIVETVLTSARRSFGGSDLRCVVILPLDSEAAFIGGIAESVAGTGFKIADFSRFEGSYIIHNGPALMIREGTLKDGKKVPINYTLVLT